MDAQTFLEPLTTRSLAEAGAVFVLFVLLLWIGSNYLFAWASASSAAAYRWHRASRDDARSRVEYGELWKAYRQRVTSGCFPVFTNIQVGAALAQAFIDTHPG